MTESKNKDERKNAELMEMQSVNTSKPPCPTTIPHHHPLQHHRRLSSVADIRARRLASKMKRSSLLRNIPVLAPNCHISLAVMEIASAPNVSMVRLDRLAAPHSMAAPIIPLARALRGSLVTLIATKRRGHAPRGCSNIGNTGLEAHGDCDAPVGARLHPIVDAHLALGCSPTFDGALADESGLRIIGRGYVEHV